MSAWTDSDRDAGLVDVWVAEHRWRGTIEDGEDTPCVPYVRNVTTMGWLVRIRAERGRVIGMCTAWLDGFQKRPG